MKIKVQEIRDYKVTKDTKTLFHLMPLLVIIGVTVGACTAAQTNQHDYKVALEIQFIDLQQKTIGCENPPDELLDLTTEINNQFFLYETTMNYSHLSQITILLKEAKKIYNEHC